MKNIVLVLCLTFLMAACSSGSSVSDIPPIIDGIYTGTYAASNDQNPDRGTMRFNLAQDQSNGEITGTFFISPDDGFTCLLNGSVTGNITGFNVSLTVAQAGGGDEDGEIVFTLSASGNTLNGTYVGPPAPQCSNQSGSGTVNLSR